MIFDKNADCSANTNFSLKINFHQFLYNAPSILLYNVQSLRRRNSEDAKRCLTRTITISMKLKSITIPLSFQMVNSPGSPAESPQTDFNNLHQALLQPFEQITMVSTIW